MVEDVRYPPAERAEVCQRLNLHQPQSIETSLQTLNFNLENEHLRKALQDIECPSFLGEIGVEVYLNASRHSTLLSEYEGGRYLVASCSSSQSIMARFPNS